MNDVLALIEHHVNATCQPVAKENTSSRVMSGWR